MKRARTVALAAILLAVACNENAGTPKPAASAAPPIPAASTAPVADLPELKADPRETVLAKSVAAILGSSHLFHRRVDDAASRLAFRAYLDRLDGQKLFLLKKHVTALEPMQSKLDDQLESGQLHLARQGEALLIARRKVVAKLVAELLSKPLDFTKNQIVEIDAEKLSYCATEAELRERWRGDLKMQLLRRIGTMERIEEARAKRKKAAAEGDAKKGADAAAPHGDTPDAGAPAKEEIPATFEGKEAKARAALATSYEARFKRLADRDPLDPAARFIGAITSVYDPHTSYLPPADEKNFDIQMTGSLEGIGAILGVKDHLVEVRELVPGGASWRQGDLTAGDLIMAVTPAPGESTVDVTDMSLDRVVALIRGPKGTRVVLRVKKADGRVVTITIVRDVVEVEASYARGAELKLGDGAPVGYINLPSFYGNTRRGRGVGKERAAASDVHALLARFKQRNLSGVILDLRSNGGGLLGQATEIVGHFISLGPVVQVRDGGGQIEVHRDEDASIAFHGNLIVLVDRQSASASEIVAGALQDYRRAVVVGTGPTHGKGTVQSLLDLNRARTAPGPPLGIFKLTIQQYFLVDGHSTQWRGVKPDVVLPDPASYAETGERHLDHAIAWSQTKPLDHTPWPAKWDVVDLASKSKSRVAAEPFFEAIGKRNAFLQKQRDDTKLSVERKAWKKRQDDLEAALEGVRKKLADAEGRFDVKSVDYGRDKVSADKRVAAKLERWRKDLAEDAWLAEALAVMRDMRSASGE